jgi:hypothetical protein
MSEGFDTRKLFPKTYLRAVDLYGKEVTVQIAEVKNEPLPGEDEAHLVLYFVGKQKTLGLNVTNRMCLEKMFGFLTKEWHGKWITFGPVKQPKAADGISILIKGSPDISETMTVHVTKYLPTVTLRKTRANGAPQATNQTPDPAAGLDAALAQSPAVDPQTGEVSDPAPTIQYGDDGADQAEAEFLGLGEDA